MFRPTSTGHDRRASPNPIQINDALFHSGSEHGGKSFLSTFGREGAAMTTPSVETDARDIACPRFESAASSDGHREHYAAGSDASSPPGAAGGFLGTIPGGRRFLSVVLVFILGVGVSLAAFFVLRDWQDADMRAELENHVRFHTVALRHRAAMGFTALRSVRGLFLALPEVTPAE
ncbi:MAG: hypothetical protein ACE5H8_12755, partial [Alphaproteobacteria bacterium]